MLVRILFLFIRTKLPPIINTASQSLTLLTSTYNQLREVNMNEEKLLNQQEAAAYLGTTIGTLNSWRHYGKQNIPFVRWGNRIRYRKADLDTWINTQTENKIQATNNP